MKRDAFRVTLSTILIVASAMVASGCSVDERPTAEPVPPTANPTIALPTASPTPTEVVKLTPSATPTPPTPTTVVIATATSVATVVPASATPVQNSPAPSPTPTPTSTLTSTPEASYQTVFVENDDCQTGISRSPLTTTEVSISTTGLVVNVSAEVADEPEERQQGLMCRESVLEGTGMLFVYERESAQSFWMFNTYVPLDIVYIDADQEPINALTMAPCPRPEGLNDAAWRSECADRSEGYGSGDPAQYALELPAGYLEKQGIVLEVIEEVTFDW